MQARSANIFKHIVCVACCMVLHLNHRNSKGLSKNSQQVCVAKRSGHPGGWDVTAMVVLVGCSLVNWQFKEFVLVLPAYQHVSET